MRFQETKDVERSTGVVNILNGLKLQDPASYLKTKSSEQQACGVAKKNFDPTINAATAIVNTEWPVWPHWIKTM